MDSLTHLVAGALTPLAFRGTPKRAAVVAFGIAVGELPDLDILFGRSVETLLTLHRGITHALFWQPVFVLIAVLPFYIWLCWKSFPFRKPSGSAPDAGLSTESPMGRFTLGRMYLVALIACVTHIYLDCMTTFGTQALLPFSEARIALPAMFIVDLCLTLPALFLLVGALRGAPEFVRLAGGPASGVLAFVSAKSTRLARIGLAWILLYPMLALGVNGLATNLLQAEFTASRAHDAGRLILMTEPFSPLRWKAIVEEKDQYRMGSIALTNPDPARLVERYAKPDPALYAGLKRQHALFGFFEAFAPLMAQRSRPASWHVTSLYGRPVTEHAFVDLRYIMARESVAARIGRRDPNFVLEARVDEAGTLLAFRFLQRGLDAAGAPWTALP